MDRLSPLAVDVESLAKCADSLVQELDETKASAAACDDVGAQAARALRGPAAAALTGLLDEFARAENERLASGEQLAEGMAYAAREYQGADELAAGSLRGLRSSSAAPSPNGGTAAQANAGEPHAIVAFSFGNRIEPDPDGSGTRAVPGPVNEQLAAATYQAHLQNPDAEIIAQHEIADVLQSQYGVRATSISSRTDASGHEQYLSTADVAKEAKAIIDSEDYSGQNKNTAAVVAFSGHESRALFDMKAQGFEASAPENVELPDRFDPESGQIWTRNPLFWAAHEAVSWPVDAIRNLIE